uniref:Uncharacterized protein n=1 Tax=Romanomermis culicivorax TaxID=13658 RepID=A0A915IS18_ROMCU
MQQTLPALLKDRCAQAYGLPKWNNIARFATAATKIRNTSQRKAVNDTEDDGDKILLDGEPSSPAVDALCRAVEEASRNAWPTAVVAASPSTMMTGAQTLAAIAQQQPVVNTFGEMLCAINDNVSIIEASPFPMATPLRSPKIGILREVHPCGGLVIDFPGEDQVSSDNNDKE